MPEHPLPSTHAHPICWISLSAAVSHVASSVSVRDQRDVSANSGWARCCWHLKTEEAGCISEAVLCVELRCRHRHRRYGFERAVLVLAVAPRAIAHTEAVLGDMAVPEGGEQQQQQQQQEEEEEGWKEKDEK